MCLRIIGEKEYRRLKAVEAKYNPVVLEPVGEIDINEVSSVLLDKMEEMGDSAADLHLADRTSRRYRKADVQKLLDVSETATLTYVKEDMDCDDFAGVLYGEFCRQRAFPGGIVDSHIHRLNWFIDEAGTFWFIEPQTRTMSRTLENWQGWDIKFFMS
jgi:hypothetical protein